ncbi:unnamed protein product [Urochloa humidicola]
MNPGYSLGPRNSASLLHPGIFCWSHGNCGFGQDHIGSKRNDPAKQLLTIMCKRKGPGRHFQDITCRQYAYGLWPIPNCDMEELVSSCPRAMGVGNGDVTWKCRRDNSAIT